MLSWFDEAEIDRYFSFTFFEVDILVFNDTQTNGSSRLITRKDLGARKCIGQNLPVVRVEDQVALSSFNCPLPNYTA